MATGRNRRSPSVKPSGYQPIGCDGKPYIPPTSPLNAGVWFWDDDEEGIPSGPITGREFAWGGLNNNGRDVVLKDILAGTEKTQAILNSRLEAIKQLNSSSFQKNSAGKDTYFDLSYLYSEDIALAYSIKQFQSDDPLADIEGEEVIYFKNENDADYISGTIKNGQLAGNDGNIYQANLDQLHATKVYDFIGQWLSQLEDIGIGTDFLVSLDLTDKDAKSDTLNAMRLAGRYNSYAKKNNLPTYKYFNLDSEPGNEADLQQNYLNINDAANKLFGPDTEFGLPIASFVNQQQMVSPLANPFAAEVAENAGAMIFANYVGSVKAQCGQEQYMCAPKTLEAAKDLFWTMSYDASLKPNGAAPTSPMCGEKTVANVRKLVDIAIDIAQNCATPMKINQDPQVSFSSFLALYAQIVEGQGDCPLF